MKTTAAIRLEPERFRDPRDVAPQATRPPRAGEPPARRTRRERRSWIVPLLIFGVLLAGSTVALALREINNGGDNAASGAVASTPTGVQVPGAIVDPTSTATAADSNLGPEPTSNLVTAPASEPTPSVEQPPAATQELRTEPTQPVAAPAPTVAFNEPFLVSALPPAWQQGRSAVFGRDDFIEGGAYRRDDGVLYGRPAAHLYAQGTDFSSSTVLFTVNDLPSTHIGLTINGMDDEIASSVACEISLNGNIVFEGPSPFQNERWTQIGWTIGSLNWIVQGENNLTIEILAEDGSFGLPPWLLINEAAIYWD